MVMQHFGIWLSQIFEAFIGFNQISLVLRYYFSREVKISKLSLQHLTHKCFPLKTCPSCRLPVPPGESWGNSVQDFNNLK